MNSSLLELDNTLLDDELNDTWSAYPRDLCVDQIFKNQAVKAPENVAFVYANTRLTYRALDEASDRLAHCIVARGTGPRAVIGVCTERSPQMVIAMLGILKAGAAYLPLDPDYPIDHIHYMLEDAECPLILGTTKQLAALGRFGSASLNVDELPAAVEATHVGAPRLPEKRSSDVAYVMYTSGTTGRPKGVAVLHYNIARLVLNTNYVHISAEDVFLQLASMAFDASTFEIWGALLNGAKLVLYDRAYVDLHRIESIIRENRVSILWLTAGLFNQIADANPAIFQPVRQLLVGGDVLSVRHIKKVAEANPNCQLINGYGPTECTTFSVCCRITPDSLTGTCIPIGRPVSNSQAYILGDDLGPVPRGQVGELFIGGDGVSGGYLRSAKLNAEKFVEVPRAGARKRLYRTGDLVRLGEDGNIYFLGRADRQLKIRGFRVEPAEVEAAILACRSIGQAVVVGNVDKQGDKRLVAYVVGESGVVPGSLELRRMLQKLLPPYIIPATFVYLDQIPLTANGKVDRNLLPNPEWTPLASHRADSARTPMEREVETLWNKTLGATRATRINESISAAGGNERDFNEIVERIRALYGVKLQGSELDHFRTTIADLVNGIRKELRPLTPMRQS